MFLIDANILLEFRRPERANPGVMAWAKGTTPSDLFISAITLFEIELGATQAARKDAAKGRMLRRWIETQVMPTCQGRIIAVDASVAQRCAALHVAEPRPQRDSLIAATALVHRMTVITRNVRDFKPMGMQLINPWRGAEKRSE